MNAIEILEGLAKGQSVDGRHVVVIAHPDDEVISFGGALQCLRDVHVVQLTSGGKPGPDEVAQVKSRRQERQAAWKAAGWDWPIIECGVPVRETYLRLAYLRDRIRCDVREADAVWTHPYEGGHLDHDSAAWLVQHLCTDTLRPPIRMEFASYHCTRTGQVFGEFWPDRTTIQVATELADDRLRRKRAAMDAYGSQRHILRKFPNEAREVYRSAPLYDFSQPPPPPRSRWDWKGYQPSTAVWREAVAAVGLVRT